MGQEELVRASVLGGAVAIRHAGVPTRPGDNSNCAHRGAQELAGSPGPQRSAGRGHRLESGRVQWVAWSELGIPRSEG